jgi:hypothetical protein
MHQLVITQILLPKETALSISIPFCERRERQIFNASVIKKSLENDDVNKMKSASSVESSQTLALSSVVGKKIKTSFI